MWFDRSRTDFGGSLADPRVILPRSVVPELAQGGKRRAAGRAGYAQRQPFRGQSRSDDSRTDPRLCQANGDIYARTSGHGRLRRSSGWRLWAKGSEATWPNHSPQSAEERRCLLPSSEAELPAGSCAASDSST